METIQEVKQFVKDNLEKGVDCPCCQQFAKLYKRKLNSGMSLFLIGLYLITEKLGAEYFKNSEIMKEMKINTSSLDYSILKHFGLMVEKDQNEGKRKSGYWKITEKGINFVEGNLKVPSHVHLYNNKVLEFSDTYIGIEEALGKHFDYRELMNA